MENEVFFMRRQADSNCCTSFCRALPSHSAMTPKTDANLEKILLISTKKRAYSFFVLLMSIRILKLLPIIFYNRIY